MPTYRENVLMDRRHLRRAKKVACVATWVPRRAARYGVGYGLKRLLPLPAPVASVPEGRMVDLPGRGRTFVVDVPGPYRDAPTVLLLHALGTTAYLTWFTALGELSRHYRVVTLDQRWHGRGIRSDRFRISDCADDAAAVLDELGIDTAVVAGYSLGGAVAQETWHRHPERVAGLVLCSTARRLEGAPRRAAVLPRARRRDGAALAGRAGRRQPPRRGAARDAVDRQRRPHPLGLRRVAQHQRLVDAGGAGRARPLRLPPWLGEVDVPTAVVVTGKDAAVPADRQRAMAEAIPGAAVFEAPGGHTSLFADSGRWLPVFLEAVAHVTDRLPDHRQAV